MLHQQIQNVDFMLVTRLVWNMKLGFWGQLCENNIFFKYFIPPLSLECGR